MAKTNSSKPGQPKTLLNYFNRVNASKPAQSGPHHVEALAITQPSPPIFDLTQDDDPIEILDDTIMETSSLATHARPSNSTSYVSNVFSSQGDLSSQGEMINTSKYNCKTWDPTEKTAPAYSSQEPQYQPVNITPTHSLARARIPKPTMRVEPKTAKRTWSADKGPSSSSSGSAWPPVTDPSTTAKRPRSLPFSFTSSSSSSSNTVSGTSRYFNSSSGASSQDGLYFRPASSLGSFSSSSSQSGWLPSSAKKEASLGWRSLPKKNVRGSSGMFNQDKEYRPALSQEQQRVLRMVVEERQNVFFTGSAGTGKSVLLRSIIDRLMAMFGAGVAVTASTGIAACNINGMTLHSFAGIGLGRDSKEKLVEKISTRSRVVDRWRKARVLIIDEISMVDAELFDKLEAVARHVRMDQRPFGGIQVVVTGDFFQLPPVNQGGGSSFAFEAQTWASVVQQTVMLKHVFRQKDQEFVHILNEMRVGKLSPKAIEVFRSLSRVLPPSPIEPAELYPLRKQVDDANGTRLVALQGETKMFYATDTGDKSKVDSCIAPAVIKLKLNAQVMLLKNMDSTLVNGSLGIVVGFAGEGKYANRITVLGRLAPNRTGQADDGAVDGMIAHRLPIVRFADDREIIIETDKWSVELPGGKEIASRTQLPLMLAWAMSIHKSQGQTLDRVRVDLGRVFEKGQAYVALSRATSMESLQILNFDPAKVMAHPKVAHFYSTLQTV